ncbi:MAG: sensor histidine kinase [Prolixibacteraceae bacterium]
MKNFIARIVVVLILLVALPAIFFLVKQASNLSENEEIVQRVFDQQLETILYTVNQNSENVIVSWVNQLDLSVDFKGEVMQKITGNVFTNNRAVEQILFIRLQDNRILASYLQTGIDGKEIRLPDAEVVDKLRAYMKSGYQRIEAVRDGDKTKLFFILKSSGNEVFALISIHSATFIDQNLKPGIQQISQDRFTISIFDSTEIGNEGLVDTLMISEGHIHEQKMLYVPGYKMNIGLQSATIDELVSERTQRDNYIFIAMLVIILLGMGFVFFSIRKEIKLAEMKSEFVSNVSHEIRTPLALISMYTETLLMKRVKTEEKKEEYLTVIHKETERLTGMVNRILNFSKMEKNKRSYHFSDVNMNELITDLTADYQPHFKAEQVNCQLVLDESIGLISADREAVTEALINLMENAVKYGKEPAKQIVIRTKNADQKIRIEVEDNGIGMAQKHLKFIFDKFYRITQGNLAHKAKGSGIGLNIVKQIMTQHNGKVSVKSKEGEGSCFTLLFNEKIEKNDKNIGS